MIRSDKKQREREQDATKAREGRMKISTRKPAAFFCTDVSRLYLNVIHIYAFKKNINTKQVFNLFICAHKFLIKKRTMFLFLRSSRVSRKAGSLCVIFIKSLMRVIHEIHETFHNIIKKLYAHPRVNDKKGNILLLSNKFEKNLIVYDNF